MTLTDRQVAPITVSFPTNTHYSWDWAQPEPGTRSRAKAGELAEARSLELGRYLPHGWQGPSSLNHCHLLLPRVYWN